MTAPTANEFLHWQIHSDFTVKKKKTSIEQSQHDQESGLQFVLLTKYNIVIYVDFANTQTLNK